jgi:hypothetical protein
MSLCASGSVLSSARGIPLDSVIVVFIVCPPAGAGRDCLDAASAVGAASAAIAASVTMTGPPDAASPRWIEPNSQKPRDRRIFDRLDMARPDPLFGGPRPVEFADGDIVKV